MQSEGVEPVTYQKRQSADLISDLCQVSSAQGIRTPPGLPLTGHVFLLNQLNLSLYHVIFTQAV